MTQSVLEQMDDQIDETAHKASRAASAVGDALEDGVRAARRAAKRGSHAAAELFDDAKECLQRRPIETVAVTFVAGVVAGAVIGWLMRRKHI